MAKKTRKERADELFAILCRGPVFYEGYEHTHLTPGDARRQFQNWTHSNVMHELIELVPELKQKYSGMMMSKFDDVIVEKQRNASA